MKMRKIGISDINDFKIGNAENKEAATGCTVIICPEGATGGVDVRGGGPATRETDLLKSENTVQQVNAVVLSGGSAFGLEAASGVARELAARDIGFKSLNVTVPIVCGASLFDLGVGQSDCFPDVQMGIESVKNAFDGVFDNGNHGAGTGATVGKLEGMDRSMKTGLGTFACSDGYIEVGAIAAVNAIGDVYNGAGNIIAGLRTKDGGSIFGTIKALKSRVHSMPDQPEETKSEKVSPELDKAKAEHKNRMTELAETIRAEFYRTSSFDKKEVETANQAYEQDAQDHKAEEPETEAPAVLKAEEPETEAPAAGKPDVSAALTAEEAETGAPAAGKPDAFAALTAEEAETGAPASQRTVPAYRAGAAVSAAPVRSQDAARIFGEEKRPAAKQFDFSALERTTEEEKAAALRQRESIAAAARRNAAEHAANVEKAAAAKQREAAAAVARRNAAIAAERAAALKQREEREAAERAAAEKQREEREAAEKAAAEKLRQEREAAERAAAEKLRQEREAAERAAAEKLRQEREAAERAAAEKLRQEREAAERAAAEKLRQEREAAAAAEYARQKAAAEKAAAEKLRQEREAAAAAEYARQKAAAEKAAAEKLRQEREAAAAAEYARQKAAAEKAAAEKLRQEREAAAAAEYARQKAAAEKAAAEKQREALAGYDPTSEIPDYDVSPKDSFVDTDDYLPDDGDYGYDIHFNTTISCLITNAKLTKPQANKLASILHDAYARAIKPVHSSLDGDTIFVLASGKQEVDFDAFAALATDVMQYAVIDGAVSAHGAYGLPAAKDL